MKLNEILDKKKTSMKDKKVAFMYEAIDRLHNKNIPERDFEFINKAIGKIWRKHHPLSDLTTQNTGGTQ